MAFLWAAMLAPAACVLWFMGTAMHNERLAARQKLADAYRPQLLLSQSRLQQHWLESTAELEKLAATVPASSAFARCVRSGIVDSIVVCDRQNQIAYPDKPAPGESDTAELESGWQHASRLEYLQQFPEAAREYDVLARGTNRDSIAARAFQSETRCLARAGQSDAVVQLVTDVFSTDRFQRTADSQGRLIAANAELLALESITNRYSPQFQSLARRLAARLSDYENPALAAPQRRFLITNLKQLSPVTIDFPMLQAEQLAAAVAGSLPNVPTDSAALQRSSMPGFWQLSLPDHRGLALFSSEKLVGAAKTALAHNNIAADMDVTLSPPDVESPNSFVAVPAGNQLPGWRLTLAPRDKDFFEAAAGRRTARFLWTGILVVAGMAGLGMLAMRLVRRQMTLARLKNDLAAIVSHELKTPLSSMRVLVETLLDSEQFDEQKSREYLELIHQENERLGRLIQNFLTFSRMERRKHAFHFSLSPARGIMDAAVESVGSRLHGPGCRLEVQMEDHLPPLRADPEAMAAALSNLLENAYKYSEEIRHIVLRARAEKGCVVFSVTDNGIGIPPGERKRILQPFYQVDQRLSRKAGGCGLGLSIVQFITLAHNGRLSIQSQPGCGSTFAIALPVTADAAAAAGKEAGV